MRTACWSTVALCVAVATGSGCRQSGSASANNGVTAPRPAPNPPPEPTSAPNNIARGNAQFGVDLLRELTSEAPDTNVFISPASIAIALAMTWTGARGQTASDMGNVLGLGDRSEAEVSEAYRQLTASLEGTPDIELAVANSVWIRNGMSVKQPFLDTLDASYDAEARTVDFGDPETADVIDAWVAEKTRGKIEDIVLRPIPPQYMLMLINAIYFRGAWANPFQEDQTEDAPFTLADGAEVTVPMMRQHGRLAYAETDQLQIVRLPYEGGRTAMTVVLPAHGTSLSEVLETLDVETWEQWTSSLLLHNATLRLPRFTLEYKKSLAPILSDMGMGVAFSPGADFSGMADGLLISAVEHKTFVEVNERGTEAAAVTLVAPAGRPFEITVDRPFLCAIEDLDTGALLFVGTIVDPRG